MEKVIYKPIGVFKCQQTQPVDSPRQAVLAASSVGVIEINSDIPLAALTDLDGFDRVWLIYDLHQNKSWKPQVRPPRGGKKRGVFSTRSPYRPNAIGMSCVVLDRIEGDRIFCSQHDLLDGTPILDIKPYLEYADSFNGCSQGWLDGIRPFQVEFKGLDQQLEWLESQLTKPLKQIITNQLSFEPLNSKIKRVTEGDQCWTFSYRTWRADFIVDDQKVVILALRSGYSQTELDEGEDPYQDKDIHRKFELLFSKPQSGNK